MIEYNVVYLCLCQGSYPKALAFAYLEELQKAFQEQHGRDVDTVARPYAFVKFGNFSVMFWGNLYIKELSLIKLN